MRYLLVGVLAAVLVFAIVTNHQPQHKNCTPGYYTILKFGKDVAFSERTLKESNVVGYKCPNGAYYFEVMGTSN